MAGPAEDLAIVDVWNGFGPLLPHRIFKLDAAGNPTTRVLDVRELDDLIENVTPTNGVLPPPTWPTTTVLPSGLSGNHFVAVRFNKPIDVDSVLDSSPGSASGLTGAIRLTAMNPQTGLVIPLTGRAFVGGRTYAGTPTGSPPTLPLQTWVSNAGGVLQANAAIDNDTDGIADGLGCPGTEAGTHFTGAQTLARASVFVFVIDGDAQLMTHEPFPQPFEIAIDVSESVRSVHGELLATAAHTSSTVGSSIIGPEVALLPAPIAIPDVTPAPGSIDVDPLTSIRVHFTESVQLSSLGILTGAGPASIDSALRVSFGPVTQETQVPFTILPESVYDLSRIVLTPAFPFPGANPAGVASCGPYNLVEIAMSPNEVIDLSGAVNSFGLNSFFETGEGPGIANAPVAPDAIYAGLRGASNPALSVIDLNGFGQGSGDPRYDSTAAFHEGWSNFPNNPNVKFQGSTLRPPLQPQPCTVQGGSAGVFTRTLDSNLDARLAQSPVLLDTSDMALGHALDTSFNNAPAPFGCQAGGGNLCAIDGLQNLLVTVGGPSTTRPAGPTDPILNMGTGVGNTVSWAPHPNPPPLVFPPLCIAPYIGGQEPTSIVSVLPPPAGVGLVNLLVPGDPFGDPLNNVPPSGLLSPEQNAWFQGPNLPQPVLSACPPYMMRQQVGQFLYVIDRVRREVVVLNSNRMTPIDRIALPDPARLAISPNLDLLAVTNQRPGTVSFISIDPNSASFHRVVQETSVGRAPLGIAWDSMNEDVLVCNERGNNVSILSAFTLTVRKVVSLPELQQPFEVVITPRQKNFGSLRNVYYGYVLSRDGRVSIFESGPGGQNGWGYDDLIGQASYKFRRPRALAVDVTDLRSGVWVAHEGQIDVVTGMSGPAGTGALTHLFADASTFGQLPIVAGTQPQFRRLEIKADVSLGSSVLTGIPTDIAFDNQRNLGALPNVQNTFSAGTPIGFNGKSLVRDLGTIVPVNNPNFLFVAVPNSSQGAGTGAVDVIQLASLTRQDTNAFQPGTQSVPMPGVAILADYFRQ